MYHEAIAWYLLQQDQPFIILLLNKAKYYFRSLGYKSRNDKIDAQGLSRMGLEQQLLIWKPLSKNLYALRFLTRQHQRLQELKTQSTNQQHALEHSAFENEFITQQLLKLVALYDQQLEALDEAIAQLIEKDSVLKPRAERLVAIKKLALLYVAVQKRLLLMAYALWRHGVEYAPLYLANRAEKDKR